MSEPSPMFREVRAFEPIPACEWCGAPSVGDREVEPATDSRLAKRAYVCAEHSAMIDRNVRLRELAGQRARLRSKVMRGAFATPERLKGGRGSSRQAGRRMAGASMIPLTDREQEALRAVIDSDELIVHPWHVAAEMGVGIYAASAALRSLVRRGLLIRRRVGGRAAFQANVERRSAA